MNLLLSDFLSIISEINGSFSLNQSTLKKMKSGKTWKTVFISSSCRKCLNLFSIIFGDSFDIHGKIDIDFFFLFILNQCSFLFITRRERTSENI